MKEQIKCEVCHLKIDKDAEVCPYCGSKQTHEVKQEENIEKDNKIHFSREKVGFIDGSRALKLSNFKHILLLIIGTLGLTFSIILTQVILEAINGADFLKTLRGNALINLISYLITFGLVLIALNRDLLDIIKIFFKEYKTYLFSILMGCSLIITSFLLNMIIYSLGLTQNSNQESVVNIVKEFPALSVLVLGFIGPIVEEFTYRVGLFSLIRKYNRIASYVVTALIFGLIHFDVTSIKDVNAFLIEIANLPAYIISGIILCFSYEKFGISGSILAHTFNNFLAVLQLVIS